MNSKLLFVILSYLLNLSSPQTTSTPNNANVELYKRLEKSIFVNCNLLSFKTTLVHCAQICSSRSKSSGDICTGINVNNSSFSLDLNSSHSYSRHSCELCMAKEARLSQATANTNTNGKTSYFVYTDNLVNPINGFELTFFPSGLHEGQMFLLQVQPNSQGIYNIFVQENAFITHYAYSNGVYYVSRCRYCSFYTYVEMDGNGNGGSDVIELDTYDEQTTELTGQGHLYTGSDFFTLGDGEVENEVVFLLSQSGYYMYVDGIRVGTMSVPAYQSVESITKWYMAASPGTVKKAYWRTGN